jgi:hypothetical protein
MRIAEDIIYILGEFANDLPEMYAPDISEDYKNKVTEAIQEAVSLLRTHALRIDHPLALD